MKPKNKRALFIAVSVLLVMMIMSLLTEQISAASIEVIGNNTGLEIVPSSNKFFEELSLSPGDYAEGTVAVKNNYNAPFELFLKTERTEEEPPLGSTDLYEQLLISVTLRGDIVYNGKMSEFAVDEGISLGIFDPSSTEIMEIGVQLPGENTGNDYQSAEHRNKWVFTAVSKQTLPKTGMDLKTAAYTIAGALLLSAGAFGVYRFKKSV